MPNLNLQRKKDLSPFRKIAIGTWDQPRDSTVYGSLTLRMDAALDYLEDFRRQTGKRLTLTHMVAKAAAEVMREMPDANAILRFNRIYLRKRIGVFLQVVMKDEVTGEIDLSGATIHDAEDKSLADIVVELEDKVGQVRTGKDKQLEQTRSAFRRVPGFLVNRALETVSFLSYGLNLDMTWAGIPRDAFGSVMITNIGSLGLEEAYVPLVPYSRVPIVVAMGAVTETPVVEDGKVVPGKVMHLCVTLDHRVLDGAHAAKMAEVMRAWIEHPYDHFDPISRGR